MGEKDDGREQAGAIPEEGGPDERRPRGFRIEVDPDAIDEAVRSLAARVRELVDQGRYTKVRISYKGRPLMPDIPLGAFLATEAVTFWYAGLLRALVVNLGVRTFIEVELVHDAAQKVREGRELYMAGEADAAEERYREALRMKPGDPEALYHLGVLLRMTGRRKEALACFEQVAASKHELAERAAEALDAMRRGPRAL